MCIRAYLAFQTDGNKSREIISDLLGRPGIVTVDVLEGAPNLMLVVEAERRQELVSLITGVLDSVEPITKDLRFFIGRESPLSVQSEIAV
jgi:hypothetical protein